jgi:hypothetical protein
MSEGTVDENYIFFNTCYTNKNFVLGAKVIFGILAPLFPQDNPLHVSWKFKLGELLGFLHTNGFSFDNSDVFYDILATITTQIKKNPYVDWKAILN